MEYYSISKIKSIEDEAIRKGMTIEKMMDNAGELSADFLAKNIQFNNVVFIAGTGNNGGDVLSTAFHLFNLKQTPFTAFIIGNENQVKEDSHKFLQLIKDTHAVNVKFVLDNNSLGNLITEVEKADLLVVGIFGTGFHGQLPDLTRNVIEIINKSMAKKVSIDIPTGINGDTGEFENAVKSDFTLTMLAMKDAFKNLEALKMCGNIEIMNILN